MLDKELKGAVVKKFARNEKDTGSSEVQIAILSERIKQLAGHLKMFPKDNHSKSGLLCMVGKRRSFLKYLEKNDHDRFISLKDSLKKDGLL